MQTRRWTAGSSLGTSFTCLLGSLLLAVSAAADTILVPDDQPTVQAAIDVAVAGDEILVAAGTFPVSSPIDPVGKAITIRGTLDTDGNRLTTLDGEGTSQVFRIRNGETPATVLQDLVIARGGGSGFGGCLRIEDGSPTIVGCRITGGSTSIKGGALLTENASSPLLRDCLLDDNLSTFAGGGLFADDESIVRIEQCRIRGNEASVGGGIYVNGAATVELVDSSVCSNLDDQVDGVVSDLGGNSIDEICCDLRDADEDGVDDCDDLCPDDPNKVEPGDCGCGVPDTDTDQDGTADCDDLCPDDPDKIEPGDCGCGVPDTDTDQDGTADCDDLCPDDPDKVEPGDCGCGVPDTDTDQDGTADCDDLCPDDPDKIEPGDCGCGVPDTDTDQDGTADCDDLCPDDPDKVEPGDCGCGVPDTDTDQDGTADCDDLCPDDPDKVEPGDCGCGVPDTDTDQDGTADCDDLCPDDPDKVEPGDCGCGVPDTDTDQDGTADCDDLCPDDPDKVEPGDCGCGVPDTDTDEDGTADCDDLCPDDPDKIEPGDCGCGVSDVDTDGDGTPDCNDTDIRVPMDAATITEAIAQAEDGFTIFVAPGVYAESIDFAGKAVVIVGDPANPADVIVDGTGLASAAVRAVSGEGRDSVLRGLTIRGGVVGDPLDDDVRGGGGLFVRNASPTIEDCRFVDNASDRGGAILALDSGLLLRRCTVRDNTAGTGGGIRIERGTQARIESCLVTDNDATGVGGGLHAIGGELTVLDTDIEDNDAGDRGGGVAWDASDAGVGLRLESVSILGNTALVAGGGIATTGDLPPALVGCSVCENEPGQIDGAVEDLGDNEICEDVNCQADFNGDGEVSGVDLGLLFVMWGDCPAPCPGDFNGDGEVSGFDLGMLFAMWGDCP